jgi:beta-barrel assembly-enhancing protease
MVPKNSRILIILGLMLAVVLAAYGADKRTKLKPGFNILKPKDDVEIGRRSAVEADRQLEILNDRQATTYIQTLGKNLATSAPNNDPVYVFQFKIVNDNAINAFALPGGFIYVNRGAIAAADNEAQIAGVMAHEIGHVVMRHGTHQMSKAYVEKMGLGILGGMLGGGALGSVINATGGFGLNALFLHYSREMESEADLIGTQILHDAGYDPKAMVEFFEKIQVESQSAGKSSQFFSDHPNPANRISDVQKEIVKLNGALPNPMTDSSEFQEMKTEVAGLPAPLRGGRGATAGGNRVPPNPRNGGRPAPPSIRTTIYDGVDIQFRNPDNWRQDRQGAVITIAPESGMVNGSLAWGMTISPFDADMHNEPRISLDDATDQLLGVLQRNNPAMRITQDRRPIRVGSLQGYVTEATNDSPAGGRETDWIVTVIAQNARMYYFVGVSRQDDFDEYRRSFRDIIDTVRFK